MRIRGAFVLMPILALAPASATIPEEPSPGAASLYLGQTPPGREPRIFAPGIVSTGMYERDITMAPDGREIFIGLIVGDDVTIAGTRWEKGGWTALQVPRFASDPRFAAFEPHVTPDGKQILFLSTRPPAGKETKPGWFYQNIWAVDRQPDGTWGDPYDPGPPVNTDDDEFYPSVTRDRTIYFTRSKRGTQSPAVYRARWSEGKYAQPERLPAPVNDRGDVYNTFVAPDESYLIGCLERRKDGSPPGPPIYVVFFRDRTDRWSDPIDLGPAVNTPQNRASSAYVSPDGKYLFFASSRLRSFEGLPSGRLTFDLLKRLHEEPGNGSSDIYWVDAGLVEDLRPQGFR